MSFDNFWEIFGRDENLTQKGSRREAAKAWEKISHAWCKEAKVEYSDMAFSQHVARMYGLASRNRAAALKAKQFVPRLPMLTTWLNQWRFDDAFENPIGELKAKAAALEQFCKCGKKAIGRDAIGGWICQPCLEQEWYESVKASENPTVQKWRPANLVKTHPKLPEETWSKWSLRVAKLTMRNAPASSPLSALTDERQSDRDWFAARGFKA